MTFHLKPLARQTIVITGASSGIGLTTARRAAKAGARVVLAARNGPVLTAIAEQIRNDGGEAHAVVTDVTQRDEVERLAQAAISTYGGFDTWVNNAGIGIFGRLEAVSDADHRQMFEVNFWGVVYGSLIAAAHLRQRGGALINLGSVLSDVAFPLQGMYCASKHAIKGFTDALRMELKADAAPVSVTLIKPSAINTPFPRHAKNYLDAEPVLPPPLYEPDDVASAILFAAERGGRDYYIGSGGKFISSTNKRLPSAVDLVASRLGGLESRGAPQRPRDGSLYRPGLDGDERGKPAYPVRRSLYTGAQTHPLTASAAVAAGLAGFAILSRMMRR